ncbi:MAG: hypothetical protein IH613_13570 [Desulfuromonadales bacterium]|nr:hypothetical protein [Desulfuromonadales bacterium]
MMKKLRTLVFSVGLVMMIAGPALAVDVDLVAEKINLTMPGTGEVIPMWGYRLATDDPGTATVPGPTISLTTADTLTINLNNALDDLGPGLVEPTSIVIPGLIATEAGAMVPTWTDGTSGSRGGDVTKRVRSFTHEALPGGNATYVWDTLTPGTYLIQSGTHPAVQVQMGLYAMLKVDDVGGSSVYDTPYNNEVDMLFSEIDPVIHNAVATGNYGPGQEITSTIDYDPRYFLLNGVPYYDAGDLGVPVVPGDNLVRFLNAGLQTRVPQLLGAYMTLLGEDGNQVPFAKDQSSLVLPAGKTFDVIVTADNLTEIPIYDRRLAFSPHVVQKAVLAEKFGVFRSGPWFLDANGNGAWDPGTDAAYVNFGQTGDQTVAGDWNNDSFSQIGVFRNGPWYLDANGNGAWDPLVDTVYANFGQTGDQAVAGDWDGNGIDQVGVFRNGTWYLDANGNGAWDPLIDTVYANFGQVGDIAVAGDWDGNGIDQVGVFRNGTWYLDANGNGAWDPDTDTVYAVFGQAGDIPVTGDWIGDGTTQIGFFRNGSWHLDMNGNGIWNAGIDVEFANFGQAGDKPVTGNWP